MAVQMLGGEEGNPYIVVFRRQDLAALEAFRRGNQGNPTIREFQAKVASLLTRPAVVSLDEVLIPYPANSALTAPYFSQRAVLYSIPGKGPELRANIEERVSSFHSTGQRAALSTSVYGGDAPFFGVTTGFQNLVALDDFRHRGQSHATLIANAAKSQTLSRQPVTISLGEVLVGIPA